MPSGAENFLGTWKIFECIDISPSVKPSPQQVEGAVFTLQDNGEIRWDLTGDVDRDFPLFQCDCFEVVYSFVGISVQMGAFSGHMFEFWVDRPVSRDMMRLTFEGWCIFKCQQVSATNPQMDFSFSLLSALTDGFFSDIALPPESSNKLDLASNFSRSSPTFRSEFKLHSVILELSGTKVEDLSNIPEDVLETLLYFLYSQSLPSTLTEEGANRCIQLAPSQMIDFTQLCRDYVYRKTLKNKIVKLVNKVHRCAEEMLGAFHHNSVTTPSRFCYVIKLALRHAAVAFIKLIEICVLYGEEASKLTRDERLEILRFAKARLPIFLTQFVAFLRCIKNDFSTVKPSDRNDIAAHVVPEIEILLDSLCNLMREARDACNDIWAKWSNNSDNCSDYSSSWSPSSSSSSWNGEARATSCEGDDVGVTDSGCGSHSRHYFHSHANDRHLDPHEGSLSKTLYSIFRERELVKLHGVHSQINAIYVYLVQKKENFEEMALASKIRCVSRNLEQLVEELPVFLLRLEEIMVAVDDRFQWKDFKFCLQLAISQVCQTIHHLRQERGTLQKFFLTLVDLIQSDEFYHSLRNLKLIEKDKENFSVSNAGEASTSGVAASGLGSDKSLPRERKDLLSKGKDEDDDVGRVLTNTHGIPSDIVNNDLNLINNLCTSRKSKDSILAKNASKLLFSETQSDMIFEVSNETETLEIPSHRVIVAARCDWFRRALLSGMKESIQKRIVIHDVTVQVFQEFLQYIYTGQFKTDISTEYLSELTALADRYEIDGLKLSCEQELALRHLDENSVIFLLSMADQFNARSLRRSCMEYIASNPGVMAKELFEELSPELQMEVYDITMWSKANRKVFSATDELLSCPRYMLVPDSPTSSSSSTATSPLPSPHLLSPSCSHRGAREQQEEEDVGSKAIPTPISSKVHHGHGHSRQHYKSKHHKHSSRSRHSHSSSHHHGHGQSHTMTDSAAESKEESRGDREGGGGEVSGVTKSNSSSVGTVTDPPGDRSSISGGSAGDGSSRIAVGDRDRREVGIEYPHRFSSTSDPSVLAHLRASGIPYDISDEEILNEIARAREYDRH